MPVSKSRAREAALEEFGAGFRRSRKGNLWCPWGEGPDQVTVTVFSREDPYGDLYWCWCIADHGGPTFGPHYDSEEEALASLADELGVFD
jgi:hypothetical protein